MQCPVLLWVWLQCELVCDDPSNTVLMMPPSLSHYCLDREDRGRHDSTACGHGLLGCGDGEVGVSHMTVGGEGDGRTKPGEVGMIRACVKARLPDDLDHQDQQKCKPEWPIVVVVC